VSVLCTIAPVLSQQLFVFFGSYYDTEQLNKVILHHISKDGMTVDRSKYGGKLMSSRQYSLSFVSRFPEKQGETLVNIRTKV